MGSITFTTPEGRPEELIRIGDASAAAKPSPQEVDRRVKTALDGTDFELVEIPLPSLKGRLGRQLLHQILGLAMSAVTANPGLDAKKYSTHTIILTCFATAPSIANDLHAALGLDEAFAALQELQLPSRVGLLSLATGRVMVLDKATVNSCGGFIDVKRTGVIWLFQLLGPQSAMDIVLVPPVAPGIDILRSDDDVLLTTTPLIHHLVRRYLTRPTSGTDDKTLLSIVNLTLETSSEGPKPSASSSPVTGPLERQPVAGPRPGSNAAQSGSLPLTRHDAEGGNAALHPLSDRQTSARIRPAYSVTAAFEAGTHPSRIPRRIEKSSQVIEHGQRPQAKSSTRLHTDQAINERSEVCKVNMAGLRPMITASNYESFVFGDLDDEHHRGGGDANNGVPVPGVEPGRWREQVRSAKDATRDVAQA